MQVDHGEEAGLALVNREHEGLLKDHMTGRPPRHSGLPNIESTKHYRDNDELNYRLLVIEAVVHVAQDAGTNPVLPSASGDLSKFEQVGLPNPPNTVR
jgi:hypothetical protein